MDRKGLKRAVPEDSNSTQAPKRSRQDPCFGHFPEHELGLDCQDSHSNSMDSDEDLFNSDDDCLLSFKPPTPGREENFDESWLNTSSAFDFDDINLDSPETYSDLDDPPPTPGKSIMELYTSSASESDSDDNESSFPAQLPSTSDCQASVNDSASSETLDPEKRESASDVVSDEEAEKSSDPDEDSSDPDEDSSDPDEDSSDEDGDGDSSDADEDSSDADGDSSDPDEDSSDEDSDAYVEELCMHCGRLPTRKLWQQREHQLHSLRDSLTAPSYITRRHMIQAPLCSCCGYLMPVSPLATPAQLSSHPGNLQRRLPERRPVRTLWQELMTTLITDACGKIQW